MVEKPKPVQQISNFSLFSVIIIKTEQPPPMTKSVSEELKRIFGSGGSRLSGCFCCQRKTIQSQWNTTTVHVGLFFVYCCFLSLLQKGNTSNSMFWSSFQEPIYLVPEREDLEPSCHAWWQTLHHVPESLQLQSVYIFFNYFWYFRKCFSEACIFELCGSSCGSSKKSFSM